jgi:hypothetical protein
MSPLTSSQTIGRVTGASAAGRELDPPPRLYPNPTELRLAREPDVDFLECRLRNPRRQVYPEKKSLCEEADDDVIVICTESGALWVLSGYAIPRPSSGCC